MLFKIGMQRRITSMHISNDMDFFVSGHIQLSPPHFIQLIRLKDCDPSRNFLRFKPGIHLINCGLRNYLIGRTLRVLLLGNLNWNRRKIHAVDSVSVILAQFLVTVHLCRLGIGCVDYREVSTSHPIFYDLEKHIPDKLIAVHSNLYRAVREHCRSRAHHSDVVSGNCIVCQTVLLNPGRLPAAGRTSQK